MEIKVSTGLVDYDLGGKVTVSINPTDITFGDKLYDAIEQMSALQEEPLPEGDDTKEVLKKMIEKDRRAREIIDNLFEKEVCRPLYDTVSVFAIADGLPLWANLLLAILEQMRTGAEKRRAELEKKIKKYTDKYEV